MPRLVKMVQASASQNCTHQQLACQEREELDGKRGIKIGRGFWHQKAPDRFVWPAWAEPIGVVQLAHPSSLACVLARPGVPLQCSRMKHLAAVIE